MLIFSSKIAQRRILAHCAKWLGLRAFLLAAVFLGGFVERANWSWATGWKTQPTGTVVLLHGMGRSRVSMAVLGARLRHAGYATANFPYRTAGVTLDEISSDLRAFIRENVKTDRYHLVTHSLGGVIVRNGFKDQGLPDGLERIVMLAPPNQPADMARVFKGNMIYKCITGETGQKLSEEKFFEELPIPPVEFGVIAGTRGQNLSFDEPNDGIVSVAGTRLEGMKDHLELKHTHTLIMNSRDTTEAVIEFLRSGSFEEQATCPPLPDKSL